MPHAYDDLREANILAALALGISDRVELAIKRASGLSGSAAAALVTLDSPGADQSIRGLSTTLELSHSGTVRLVDRLEADGLVERRPGSDRRSIALALTPDGRRVVARIRAARADSCVEFIKLLTDEQRNLLIDIQEDVLAEFDEHSEDTPWVCRLCDRYSCRHGRAGCPVEAGTNRRSLSRSRASPPQSGASARSPGTRGRRSPPSAPQLAGERRVKR